MAADEQAVKACGLCGATIYPEHMQNGSADFWSGKLLCPHCLSEKKATGSAPLAVDAQPADAAERSPSIQAFGDGGVATEHADPAGRDFRRPLLKDSDHATRCKTFHCRLSDAAFSHINQQINEWVDTRDEVEIKHVVSTVGVVEGKHTDPHLIITIFF